MATPVSDWCIRALQRVISDLARFEDGRSVHLQSLEAQQLQLELAFREAVAVEAIQGGYDVSGAVDLVSEALSIVRCEMEHRESERGYHTILFNATQNHIIYYRVSSTFRYLRMSVHPNV